MFTDALGITSLSKYFLKVFSELRLQRHLFSLKRKRYSGKPDRRERPKK
jgi:hypothetical protein